MDEWLHQVVLQKGNDLSMAHSMKTADISEMKNSSAEHTK